MDSLNYVLFTLLPFLIANSYKLDLTRSPPYTWTEITLTLPSTRIRTIVPYKSSIFLVYTALMQIDQLDTTTDTVVNSATKVCGGTKYVTYY